MRLPQQQAPLQSYAPAPRGLRIEKKLGGFVLKIGRKYRVWSLWSEKYVKPSTFIFQLIMLSIIFQYIVLFFGVVITPKEPILEDLYFCTISQDGKVYFEFENIEVFYQLLKPGTTFACHSTAMGGEAYLYVSEQLYEELVGMVEEGSYSHLQGDEGILVLEFHL